MDYQPIGSDGVHFMTEEDEVSIIKSHTSHPLNAEITQGVIDVFPPRQEDEDNEEYTQHIQDQTKVLTIVNAQLQQSELPNKQQSTGKHAIRFANNGSDSKDKKGSEQSSHHSPQFKPILSNNPFLNVARRNAFRHLFLQ
ncbi:hypothetical protein P691DRAFT_769548 [Macrolepiota fuliginosa MF-IS2]|uniref:Uncharacterized protein n=1 Tax=Macrolepiota fuliginosa MF-IS2 TaxID=1400762 RepID=A0A9P5WWK6_9AGAR|nr:hypothetical protein P691DRAFT_769548 [Macrolepiota fuliginosa MF-IS2]